MVKVKISKIPKTPGVYIFRHGNLPIYIGKASNLKSRLFSYWRKDISDKVRQMLLEATKLDWYESESEVDALIKEAELIKSHIPKYNILMRDDKNYFYVAFTKDEFPQIYLTHQLASSKANYLGPFTSGDALKATLRLLRRIFPFCTCKEQHKRPCLSSQLGRCPGYCCLKDKEPLPSEKLEYKKNIRNIVAVLNGKSGRLQRQLAREMKEASRNQDYETAAKLRDQIAGLENILKHASYIEKRGFKKFLNWPKVQQNLETILGLRVKRAEGYDISNISGTDATGSMVVFVDGKPDKSEYRKFKIKTVQGANDIAMHTEVIRRRLLRKEWGYPELMLIDGGKAQLNAAIFITKAAKSSKIKIAALAKREEELYIAGKGNPILLRSLPPDTAFFFQRIRDESHRFAKKYHHKRREILYRNN